MKSLEQKEIDIAWLSLATHPHIHFSRSICEDKFPNQYKRWIKCPANARWMLRNKPVSPLSNNQRDELVAIAKLDESEKRAGDYYDQTEY